MLVAGESVVAMVEIWKRCGRVIGRADHEQLFALYRRHMEEIRSFGIYSPKHHLVWHLLFNSIYQGNPNVYSNWLDEALNKTLKACCRLTSQLTFEVSVLLRVRAHLCSRPRPRRAA